MASSRLHGHPGRPRDIDTPRAHRPAPPRPSRLRGGGVGRRRLESEPPLRERPAGAPRTACSMSMLTVIVLIFGCRVCGFGQHITSRRRLRVEDEYGMNSSVFVNALSRAVGLAHRDPPRARQPAPTPEPRTRRWRRALTSSVGGGGDLLATASGLRRIRGSDLCALGATVGASVMRRTRAWRKPLISREVRR
jgi:hypothetical protein